MIRHASQTDTLTTRRIAPEDLLPGMYVTVLREEIEACLAPSSLSDTPVREVTVSRYTRRPWDSGAPLHVVGVCLPFVLVARPDGDHETLDVRHQSLARLTDRYGGEAFRRLAADARREKDEQRRRRTSEEDDE